MKRRNRESRARIKLIQERHYTKEEQRAFDTLLSDQKKRYADAYADYCKGYLFSYDMAVGLMRGARAIWNCGVSAQKAVEAIKAFNDALRAVFM